MKYLITLIAMLLPVLFVAPAHAETRAPERAMVVAPPTANTGYHCVIRQRHDRVTRRVTSWGYDHYWYLKATAKFAVCRKQGHKTFSMPLYTRVSYNRSGTHQYCRLAPVGMTFDHMRANPNFHDAYGNRFNPPEFHVPCRRDTTASRTQYYSTAHRLYWSHGRPPSATIWWALRFKGGRLNPQPHGNFHIPLKGV